MTSLPTMFEHIDQFAAAWMGELAVPGLAIAITDREKLLRISTYGLADVGNRVPVTPQSLFEIGSLGKPFTSIALLQLRDEGMLDLHAPVVGYLPWFAVQSVHPPITVHHLMNHTAGIVRGTDIAPHGLYEAWALRETKTSAPPGEYFSYSNIGYKTLGFLLEALTGQPFPDVIRSRVLQPIGMRHTHPATTNATRREAAIGYCGFYDDRPEHARHGIVPAIWAEYGTGDGCEASTAADMALYVRMLLNRGRAAGGQLISKESFDLMTLNGVWTGGDYYGYGLATYPAADGRTYVGHGGGNAGFRSAIVVDLEAGLGVVFLLNRMGETDPVVDAAQYVLTVMRAGERGGIPPQPPHVDPQAVANAAHYVGAYRSGSRVLQIVAEGGTLQLHSDGSVVTLEQRGPDSFYVPDPAFELFLLDFKREGEAVVEAFHGADWYVNERYDGPTVFDDVPEWESYPGHYRARNPELSNFRVVLRKGALALIIAWGTTEPLVPIGDRVFRIGDDPCSPETLRFDPPVDGRVLRVHYSGCAYYRSFTR